jgi:hypothetical protein
LTLHLAQTADNGSLPTLGQPLQHGDAAMYARD